MKNKKTKNRLKTIIKQLKGATLSTTFISAPAEMRTISDSVWPFSAAQCAGVKPFYDNHSDIQ